MPHCNFLLLLLSLQTRMMNQRNLKVKPGEGTVIYRSSTHCLVTVSVKNEYILHCPPLGLNKWVKFVIIIINVCCWCIHCKCQYVSCQLLSVIVAQSYWFCHPWFYLSFLDFQVWRIPCFVSRICAPVYEIISLECCCILEKSYWYVFWAKCNNIYCKTDNFNVWTVAL